MTTFVDFFAWVGWIKIWFEQAWFKCIFSNDFDKYCKHTFDENFPVKMTLWDITNLNIKDIPDFDIFTWWFPCQPFSIAWYRHWFNDGKGRGNLFFDVLRILKAKKPKAILLENVKNLKTHDKWNTLNVILKELKNLWYHVTYSVLNTMEYGNIPQNRERIYIVWFLSKDALHNFSFPNKLPLKTTIHDFLEKKIDDKYYYNNKPLFWQLVDSVTNKNTIYQWRRKYVRENKNKVCPTLTANMGMWWHNVPIILDKKWIRKLTPRECANFQWFPQNYILPAIADSQLYKQFGNSVSVPVIKRVAENMKKALNL